MWRVVSNQGSTHDNARDVHGKLITEVNLAQCLANTQYKKWVDRPGEGSGSQGEIYYMRPFVCTQEQRGGGALREGCDGDSFTFE